MNFLVASKGKLYLLQLVLTSPQFLLLDEPTRNFPHFPTRNSNAYSLDYPGGLVTVPTTGPSLKKSAKESIVLTENGLVEIGVALT